MSLLKISKWYNFSIPVLFLIIAFLVFYSPKHIFGRSHRDTLIVNQLLDSARVHKFNLSRAKVEVDSAINIAKKINSLPILAKAYFEKGNIFKVNNQLVQADSSYQQAYIVWQDISKTLDYLSVLKALSIVNYYLGHDKEMLRYALEGIQQAQILHSKLFEGVFNNLSGIAMDNMGDQSKALSYYLNSLNIFEDQNDKVKIASVETNIGNIYDARKQYIEAEKYYKNALDQALHIGDTSLISAAYNNLGIVYSSLKQYDIAKKYLIRGWLLSQKLGDSYAVSNSLTNLGKLYSDLRVIDSAQYYYDSAYSLAKKVDNSRIEYYALSNLAEFYELKGQTNKAIEYAKQAFAIATSGGTIKDQLYVMKLLNIFYAKLGNYKKVHELLTEYIALNDSLYSKEMSSQMMIIETQNQIRSKSRELLLEHESAKRREAYFFIAILVLLLTIVILVYLFESRRSRDAEYKRQKSYLDALLEESESYVSVIDEKSENSYVSPSYLRVFGREGENRVGRSPFEYVHPDDVGSLMKIRDDLESGKLEREHVMFKLKNNSDEYRIVRGIIKKVSEHSFIKGFIINFWDVTEIQKSELALKKSEEKYRNIFNAFPDIYFMMNHEGIITEISPSVTKITGFLPRGVIGKSAGEFIAGNVNMEKARLLVVQARKLTDYNIDIVGKDGRKIHCSLSAHLVNNSNGDPAAIEGILRDITERVESEKELKYSERQLKETNASKDKLLSLISHDVRGAIGTQKAILSMVSEDVESFTKEEVFSLVQTIKKSVDNTFTLVENLLSWARIMRDNIKTDIVDNNVYSVIEESFEFVKEQADSKEISLHYEGRNDVRAKFDTTLMTAVIRNLLTNAIKFSNQGSKIWVVVKEDEKFVNISVMDRGIGLTVAEVRKILSGNDNIHSKLGTKNEKGTGLGMIIVREFVAMNKGKLSIKSEPGKGTEFIVTISKSK